MKKCQEQGFFMDEAQKQCNSESIPFPLNSDTGFKNLRTRTSVAKGECDITCASQR